MKKLILPTILLTSCITLTHAVDLVSYTFDADGSATNAFAAVSGGVVTEDNLGTFNTSVDHGYPTGNVFQVSPPNNTTTDYAAALTNNSAFTFTLTANSDSFNIDSLSFDVGRGGNATARGFAVRSSLTGTTTLLQDDTVDSQRPVFTNYSVDLSSNAAFDNIGSSVTFTIYVYTPATGNSLEFDNIIVAGSIVPEPSVYGLLAGASALAFVALRRRKA